MKESCDVCHVSLLLQTTEIQRLLVYVEWSSNLHEQHTIMHLINAIIINTHML